MNIIVIMNFSFKNNKLKAHQRHPKCGQICNLEMSDK